jgi:nicotinamidase-related amidase
MTKESKGLWPATPPAHAATALVVIDMQNDFCAPGGWVDQLGEDVSNTRSVIAPIGRVLAAAREAGLLVIHTREGHRSDLSDLHPNKQWRTRAHGLGIGDKGANGRILVRGEPGWEIVPELAPLLDEPVIDKPGKSSFHATDLEGLLRARGITHLVLTGVTSDCCVQSTMRDAMDRGFSCSLLADCTAAVETANHLATLAILQSLGGKLGRVANSVAFLSELADRHV